MGRFDPGNNQFIVGVFTQAFGCRVNSPDVGIVALDFFFYVDILIKEKKNNGWISSRAGVESPD